VAHSMHCEPSKGFSGRLICTRRLKGLDAIPRHPGRGILRQPLGVFLQRDEILDGTVRPLGGTVPYTRPPADIEPV